MAARPKVTINDSDLANAIISGLSGKHAVEAVKKAKSEEAPAEIYGVVGSANLSSVLAEMEVNGTITVPFKDGSKMTISIAPDVVRLSFVCHKAGVEKALVLNRTGNAVKTIADLL